MSSGMDAKILRKMLENSFAVDIDSERADPGQTVKGRHAHEAYRRVLKGFAGEPSPAERRTRRRGRKRREELPAAESVAGQSSCYELMEKLARGGMGDVYRAYQSGLEREVALKLIRDDSKDATGHADAFVAEALAAGYLDHPNIAPVYDLLTTDKGEPAIAMKLIGGTSWRDLIHPSTPELEKIAAPLGLERHLEILISVGNAVAFAHSKGIIHRDIKPANVMVGRFGEVFLMDWGMAVSFKKANGSGRLRAPYKDSVSEPGGTPSYLAPEMAEARGRDLGPWTDVYLMGATLYEVLTGRSPHRGKSILAIVTKASRSNPPKFGAGIPDELQAICKKAMARDITKRYQTVQAFQDAVREFLNHRQSRMIVRNADEKMKRCSDGQLERRLRTERERVRAYSDLSEALAGYRQALVLWEENPEAANKERETRMSFAQAAIATGDFALAKAQLEGLSGRDVRALDHQLQEAVEQRDRSKRTLKLLRAGIATFAALLIVGLGVGFVLVTQQKQRADANSHEAERNARRAEVNLTLAEQNAREANANEQRAREAAARAEKTAKQKSAALDQLRIEKERADANAEKARQQAAIAQRNAKEAEENLRLANENARQALTNAKRALRAQRAARKHADRADAEAELKSKALGEVRRLADLQILQRFEPMAENLLAGRGGSGGVKAWLDDVEDIVSRRERHDWALLEARQAAADAYDDGSRTVKNLDRMAQKLDHCIRLRGRVATATTDTERRRALRQLVQPEADLAKLRRTIGRSKEYRFEDEKARFRHDILVDLVGRIEKLVAPDDGLLARVKSRLAGAGEKSQARRDTVGVPWSKVIRSVASNGRYDSLELTPQEGLLPLGPDPDSHLHEFLHLASHEGPVPERSPSGHLEITADTGVILVLLPGGPFEMGSQSDSPSRHNFYKGAAKDERPAHTVDLGPFLIAKHEMTQAQWKRLLGKNPSRYGDSPLSDGRAGGGLHPVEMVSWRDCRKLAEHGLRLPTEAQWEYAARAGSHYPWWTGRDERKLERGANLADRSRAKHAGQEAGFEAWDDSWPEHAPVGSFRPNRFGLHDVIGNVWEWCRDGFASYVKVAVTASDGRRGDEEVATRRVIRGGSYLDEALNARSAKRRKVKSTLKEPTVGLRPMMPVR